VITYSGRVLLPVYKALIDDVLGSLDRWCQSEETDDLQNAIKSLRVLQLYSAEE
jgi:hypothetical protein